MRKWSYRVELLPEDAGEIQSVLEVLGDIGWELVESWEEAGTGQRIAILKRPAPGLPQ